MSDIKKTMEAYLEMVSERKCMKKEETCPKCGEDPCVCDDEEDLDEENLEEGPVRDKRSYEAGKKAALAGKKYSENPMPSGSQAYLDWSKGHNAARAKKAGMREEVELDEAKSKVDPATVKKLRLAFAKTAGMGDKALEIVAKKTGVDIKTVRSVLEKTVNSVAKSAPSKDAPSYSDQPKSAVASKGKDAGKTGVAAQGVKKEALDPVNDKENDKKFKDRKDKDIDNDGDVDSSDEYLHKRRAATDDAIDGGDKPADNADPKDDKKKGKKTAEISKIGEKVTTKEDFDAMWAAFEEAVNQKKGATEPEKMDDKQSPKTKEFVKKHTVDKKDHDEMEKIEEPKKREVKKEEVSEYEVIRRILSGNIEG
jgi:hypothetical protein